MAKAVTDSGGDGEVIVLLHGFTASSRYWKRLQPQLSRLGYRVVALDLLGFGRAARLPGSRYDYDEHVVHIHRLIEELGLNQPFKLVGHSMGAILAAKYNRLYPNNVSRLYLLHPPIYKDKAEARGVLRRTSKGYRYLLDSPYRNIGWKILTFTPFSLINRHSSTARDLSMIRIIESSELVSDLRSTQTATKLLVGLRDRPEYLHNLKALQFDQNVSLVLHDVAHHSPLFQPRLVANVISKL